MAKLALDLGTVAGFAATSNGALISGTIDLKPKKYEGAGMRYLRFREWLDRIHSASPIEIIWFEAVRRHIGTDAAHVYGGLMATLETWCEVNRVPYEGVPVGTIKKSWTGKGNATKEAMIAEARRRGFEVLDDNEADALALLSLKVPDLYGVEGTNGDDAKKAA